MRNHVRHSFAYILVVAMIVSFFGGVPVKAEDTEYTSGDYKYTLDTNGNATITRYKGSATVLDIPATLDGHPVTTLGTYSFIQCNTLENVTIPAGVTGIGDGAFYECKSLTSINIPEGVTEIGQAAFDSCKITNIVIPGSVKTIGKAAFILCEDLSSVEISYGVETIGASAFSQCSSLSSITIPDSVTSIESSPFWLCDKLASVKLPAGLREMNATFNGCSALAEVTIPSGVTDIGIATFQDCSSLKSITLPEGVTGIGDYAFRNCTALTEVNIPAAIKTIGQQAFSGCANLASVSIPNGVTDIGEQAFYGCQALTEVTLPPSVQTVGDGCFYDRLADSWLEVCFPAGSMNIISNRVPGIGISYTVNNDGTVSAKVEWYAGDYVEKLVIPRKIAGYPVSSLDVSDEYASQFGDMVLEDPFTITSQPKGVSTVYGSGDNRQLAVGIDKSPRADAITCQWYENDAAIEGATGESYTIPENTKVGTYSYFCTVTSDGYSVTTDKVTATITRKPVTVQADSKTRTEGQDNPELTFTVPVGALVAGDTTADWAGTLTTTATKDSPTGQYPITGAFTSENYEITVTPGVLTIEAAKENGQENIELVNPEETTPKKGDCFKDSKGSAIYKVTKAGTKGKTTGTVEYMKPVKASTATVTIPATITVGGIKYQVTSIAKNAFKSNKKLTKVTIGKYVKTIGANAFYNCTKLKTVTLGASVATIGDKAFYKCTAITKITLPSKVSKIGKQAFYGCKKLKTITVKSKLLKSGKVGKQTFKGIYAKATIKVPKSKYTAYMSIFKKAGAGKGIKGKKI